MLNAPVPAARKDREWFWIDDEIGTLTAAIQQAGIPLDRCIQSNPQGQDELLVLRSALTDRLAWLTSNTSEHEDAA